MIEHGGRTEPARDPVATAETRQTLIAALRALPFQFSGVYEHEGGARITGRRTRVGGTEPNDAALRDPLYRLDEPVYREEEARRSSPREEAVRFSLAIDIDGSDPLHVVSGAVAGDAVARGTPPPHFIGRVVENKPTTGGRRLVVGDFVLPWPGSVNRITRLEIVLTGSPLIVPTAEVTFIDAALDRRHGPFVVEQRSPFFHEVEVDLDREANAIDPEPLSTQAHPDRPSDLPASQITLESAFAAAGVRITRSVDKPDAISGAGGDHRWSYAELHDSMILHWQAFANRPQWKMWIFLAERADDDGLGGVMFDGDIDEPGGVDRQGTALFTRCPFFHTDEGEYPRANPPVAEAVRRELFFNLIHETGHAFNLAHSFQKGEGAGWRAPAWMPLSSNAQSLSWMNYPDAAAQGMGGGPSNATWFYRRFRFRFDDGELLFLRHAPDRYLEMGGEAWFSQHGRVARSSLDPRLRLSIRTRKGIFEQGEPVLLELKLQNVSGQPVAVHRNLDPSDGLVDIAVTNPKGERRPFLPFDHTRTRLIPHILEPSAEAVFALADATMGAYGFHFKEPGPYRLEASYTNVDGRTAAAVLQVYVRPAPTYDAVPIINELFDAAIGRALYVEGTRVQEDVNDKIDWIRERLTSVVGERHPIEAHLRTIRYKPLMTPMSIIQPVSNALDTLPEDPDVAVQELEPVLVERADATADTMGHIWYVDTMKAYSRAAQQAGRLNKARDARTHLAAFCRARGIVSSVTEEAERAAISDAPV
jgi:hypothetical protein